MPYDPARIDPDQVNDVFASFGLAAYNAQCFEMTLTNFLLLHQRHSDIRITVEEIESLEATLLKKTLGGLLADFRKLVTTTTDSDNPEDVLTTALKRRNDLTHRFFRDRAVHFLSEAGREIMIAELVEIANAFTRADVLVSAMHKALGQALGFTDEMLAAEFSKLEAEADSLST
jgi:hypothetical protein